MDVPTDHRRRSAGATFDELSWCEPLHGGTAGTLDPGDTIAINFSENLAGVDGSDTITVMDVDGEHGDDHSWSQLDVDGQCW